MADCDKGAAGKGHRSVRQTAESSSRACRTYASHLKRDPRTSHDDTLEIWRSSWKSRPPLIDIRMSMEPYSIVGLYQIALKRRPLGLWGVRTRRLSCRNNSIGRSLIYIRLWHIIFKRIYHNIWIIETNWFNKITLRSYFWTLYARAWTFPIRL